MGKASDTSLVQTASAAPAARRFRLAPLSLIAPPISWAIIFIARHISDGPFSDASSNLMIALLWIGGAVTLVGFVLAILALRRRETESRPLAITSIILNFINLVFYAFIGLLAILITV